MLSAELPRVGYVVKRYPRYSETFIVNEILAHEAAGLPIEIFSLYPCIDSHFQDAISRVRSPVRHIHAENVKGTEFWSAMEACASTIPDAFAKLNIARADEAKVVYQGLRVAAAVRQTGITHLHAHFATSAAAVARIAAALAGISYSITAHAKDIFHESVDPVDLAQKLKDASAVVTVSDFNLKFLKENYPQSASRVVRIYNGLDLKQLAFNESSDRPNLIAGVGRLVEKKGFADLVAACAILRDRKVDFECQIVGEGECGGDLRQQIRSLHLQPLVRLVGPMAQRDVFDVLRRAAVFAAPCIVGKDGNRDGLPTVLLEAMAVGTPCVSTDVTGIPEVVRNEDTGLLTPQSDPPSLANALQKLLGDMTIRRKLAANARQLIEREFDIHSNAAQIRSLFRSEPAGRKA